MEIGSGKPKRQENISEFLNAQYIRRFLKIEWHLKEEKRVLRTLNCINDQ